MQPSWSSGVNIYQVSGTYLDNQIIGNVSFENIDISTHHSDGSGFILDFGSTGALFQNNIGFRNGGSCLRVTNSSGAHLINNSCYHDALDPNNTAPAQAGEIYFSDALASTGVVASNNLAAAGAGMNAINRTTGTGSTFQNNLVVNSNGATPFFANPTGIDFKITAGSNTVIDQGTAAGAASTDVGFDPKCIKAQTGQAVSWWQYAPDYIYIQSVGGVAGCFHPSVRPQGNHAGFDLALAFHRARDQLRYVQDLDLFGGVAVVDAVGEHDGAKRAGGGDGVGAARQRPRRRGCGSRGCRFSPPSTCGRRPRRSRIRARGCAAIRCARFGGDGVQNIAGGVVFAVPAAEVAGIVKRD